MICIAGAGIDSTTSPAGNVALTIGIPPGTEEGGLFFIFTPDANLKREKI